MQISFFHAASTLATARLIMLSRYLSRAFSARSFPDHKQQIDIIYFEKQTLASISQIIQYSRYCIYASCSHTVRCGSGSRRRYFMSKKMGEIYLKNKSSS
jgi:hypothetical protein